LMAGECSAPTTGNGFLEGTLTYLDCQAQSIAAAGYQSLASPISSVSLALTGLLSIYIAIIGIKMLMGHVPTFGQLTASALKIGIVLVLATSWSAYRIVVYDTVLKGPAELFSDIGQASGLPGSNGGLVARLQSVDNAILFLVAAGTGRNDVSAVPQGNGIVPVEKASVNDDLALGLGRTVYVAGIIGAMGLVRLLAAILLALAPVFAGLLLFGATRGFFWGWLRLLVATAISSLMVTIVIAVELAILEPWLSNVLNLRQERIATPAAAFEFMALAVAFTFIKFGAVFAGVRLSFAYHIDHWLMQSAASEAKLNNQTLEVAQPITTGQAQSESAGSRASIIAQAVVADQQRGFERTNAGESSSANNQRSPNQIRDAAGEQSVVRLGQSYRRTARRTFAVGAQRSEQI
jgi:type IV secretion system protein VirB6